MAAVEIGVLVESLVFVMRRAAASWEVSTLRGLVRSTVALAEKKVLPRVV
jgi:hypothetical protein